MPEPSPLAADDTTSWYVSVHSPGSHAATLTVESARDGARTTTPMRREGPRWCAGAAASDGDRYWLDVDGVGPLVDPAARDLVVTADGPRGVVRRSWPAGRRIDRRVTAPVVYEMHVRGFARTFAGVRERLPYLADLGVDVIELMPVHPFDTRDNYWGYMPIVWGAVHGPYAADGDAPGELAGLAAAAHEHGIEVWLDVVFNHTGEGDASQPTWTFRGLDDAHAYLHEPDGSYNDDAGCGNVVDVRDAEVRALVLDGLQRYAELGIDGFRFDLASILTRDGGSLVCAIGDWADRTGVRLVAEAWDLAAYQVGDAFPDRRWRQWNDRYREDVRGFLRAEPGIVAAVMNRIAGSPDLYRDDAWRSVNYVSAHDGLTLHDLTAVTSDRHRSWDTGPALRLQQLKNAFTLLLLSAGTAMFVMGDEFARTQHGHDNPYDVDGELTWVDWGRLTQWGELHAFVRDMIRLRRVHVVGTPRFHGTCGAPDTTAESRALAWSVGGLYVMANMSWESASFTVAEPGSWRVAAATLPGDVESAAEGDTRVQVAPRSIVVLERDGGEERTSARCT